MSIDTVTAAELARLGVGLKNHQPVKWRCRYRVDKYWGPVTGEQISAGWHPSPYESIEEEGNLLMTVGATALFNGLVTAGLGTPFNSTNAQIVVGDSSTAATAADTDMGAVAGTKLNAADVSSASNATPIVVAGTYSPTPVTGQVVVCSAFSGAGASAINNTFEITAASGSTLTLLNSAGSGSITVTGGLVKPINKYRQTVNGAPSVSTNTCQFVSVFGTTNANYQWNEWGICTGGGATNKQSVLPPTLLNHAISSLGTKTSAATWTLTTTLSIS